MKKGLLSLIVFLLSQVLTFAQSPSVNEPQTLYDSAHVALQAGDLLTARKDLEQIIDTFPNISNLSVIRKEWGNLMMRIIHSDALSPEAMLYEVLPGDALEKIARNHGTTIELIKERNKLKTNNIKPGQKLSLWNHPFTIEVFKASNRLDLKLGNNIIKEYAVSTGKSNTTTPLGEFTIKDRYPNPTWFHHGDIVPGGTPENWLGTRWLGFNIPKYGIHGTIYPELIGQSVSGGCIRMKNQDVEELYDIIPIGTKVTIMEDNLEGKEKNG